MKFYVAAEYPSHQPPISNMRCLICPVWATVNNMAASIQRTRSRCKYKLIKHKGPILGLRKQQFVQFRGNTLVKTPVEVFYIKLTKSPSNICVHIYTKANNTNINGKWQVFINGFLVLMTTQSALQYSLTFTHSHARSYSASISSTFLFYQNNCD